MGVFISILDKLKHLLLKSLTGALIVCVATQPTVQIMPAATMARLAAAANGGVAYALPVAALLKCIVSSSCRKITTSAQAQETITIRTLSSSIKDF